MSTSTQAPQNDALRLGKWLDPRKDAPNPIVDSVNLPVDELAARVHELPSRDQTVCVADVGPEADAARSWFETTGRSVLVAGGFTEGPRGLCRLWSPTRFLEAQISQIDPKSALDLACGSGRDAVYLASLGIPVVGVDLLEDALDLARDLERRYRPDAAPDIQWVSMNLEREIPTSRYDLVTCFRYLDREMFGRIGDLLNPGGWVFVETFTTEHRRHFGKPRRDEHVLQPGELREVLNELEILEYDEGWHDGRHTARLWARNSTPRACCAED